MPSILFVCTANRCRSPVAEAIFRREIARSEPTAAWRIASAGTWTRAGDPAMARMVSVAAQFGLDLSGHRAQLVSRELIESADLVLTMEQGQAEALRVEFPERADRIHLLSTLTGPGYDIADPVGRSEDEHLITVRQLERIIVQGMARIQELVLPESS